MSDFFPRVGIGYDVHRLVENRPLILGGVHVPFEKGLDGHSDADVLTHAIIDALLGAAGLGDIGRHFPDTNPAFAGADSLKLLADVADMLAKLKMRIANVDATVVAQEPKLAGHIPAMSEYLSRALSIPEYRVKVKATTEEGMGFTGAGLALAAQAIAALVEERK